MLYILTSAEVFLSGILYIFKAFAFSNKQKKATPLVNSKKTHTFAAANAQMAELVDALVSNTSGFTSMPVRSRLWARSKKNRKTHPVLLFSPRNILIFVPEVPKRQDTYTRYLRLIKVKFDRDSLSV
jgi:hypothetical protein